MYLFTMKKGYQEYVFSFDDFYDGCKFMIQAINHCTEEITFIVNAKEEEIENEE